MSDVSVVIAAWNAEDTLEAAICSALNQVSVTVDVVVVDDASTDATLATARKIATNDSRVTVLQQSHNLGPAAARNRGLGQSKSSFVTVLDSDDQMEPGRLRSLVEIAQEGNWDLVADDLYKVSSRDHDAPRSRLWTNERIGCETITFESFVKGNLSRLHGGRGELGFLKPLMRRDFLDRHGLRYAEDMRLGEDYALYATALARGARFCLTDPFGYLALVRPDSLSGKHRAADLAALVAADHRLMTEKGLEPSDRRILRAHEIETQKRWRWLRLIEAVRSRDAADAVRCFAAHPSVIWHLLANLSEQALQRSTKALSARTSKEEGGA